jgi:integrase
VSVQRYLTPAGKVRYRARVKFHGRGVTSRVFERRADAVAWEQDQRRRLRSGEWLDPRRGHVPLKDIAELWLASRQAVKRRTWETDRGVWQNYIAPRWANWPVSSITSAEVAAWLGQLLKRGLARSTVTRALAALRSLLDFAVADGRVTLNVAASVRTPAGGRARREGQALATDELVALVAACRGRYAELVLVLAFQGLRWGELAGLQVGDRVLVPGPGLRLSRTVLASNGGGELYTDTLKSSRARTVPLVPLVVPIIERWSQGKAAKEWLFSAPEGGPLRETNWKRSVRWAEAKRAIGRPGLRVHDLRHTAASIWLGAGADPKVVQRVLGHASATMTMDLYGHLIDRNLWQAARRFGDTMGTRAEASDNPELHELRELGCDQEF